MKIVFMGSPDFAIPSLHILLDHSYNIQAVVTVPDKPQGRGRKLLPSPVKSFALEKKLLVLQPEKLSDAEFITQLKKLDSDIFVVVAFRILPKEVYTIPRYGSFNLHPSLLPKYRGPAPINWAIINGEKETGVTTFFLQDKIDSGSIILQMQTDIGIDETAGELHDRLAEFGAQAVLQTVQMIENGKTNPKPQDDSLTTNAPKIFKDDCRINWNNTAEKIHNFVRGLSPYPTAWTIHNNKKINLYRTKLEDDAITGIPGAVYSKTKDSLKICTGKGIVSILEVQQEGRRKLSIGEFLRGYPIEENDSFI